MRPCGRIDKFATVDESDEPGTFATFVKLAIFVKESLFAIAVYRQIETLVLSPDRTKTLLVMTRFVLLLITAGTLDRIGKSGQLAAEQTRWGQTVVNFTAICVALLGLGLPYETTRNDHVQHTVEIIVLNQVPNAVRFLTSTRFGYFCRNTARRKLSR